MRNVLAKGLKLMALSHARLADDRRTVERNETRHRAPNARLGGGRTIMRRMNVTVAQSRAARAMLAWSSWMTSPTAPAYIAIRSGKRK